MGDKVAVPEAEAQLGPVILEMMTDPNRVPKGSARRDVTVLTGVLDIGRIAATDCSVRSAVRIDFGAPTPSVPLNLRMPV